MKRLLIQMTSKNLRDSFYTTLCNALDYTTSAFPVTFVDHTDVPHEPHEFYNHEDEAIYKLCRSQDFFQQIRILSIPVDKTDIFQGCPVGLQLIGRTLEEEGVLRMTVIVDDALTKWKTARTVQ